MSPDSETDTFTFNGSSVVSTGKDVSSVNSTSLPSTTLSPPLMDTLAGNTGTWRSSILLSECDPVEGGPLPTAFTAWTLMAMAPEPAPILTVIMRTVLVFPVLKSTNPEPSIRYSMIGEPPSLIGAVQVTQDA